MYLFRVCTFWRARNNFFSSCPKKLFPTVILYVCTVIFQPIFAQVRPQNLAQLNYNQVLFQWENCINADKYVLEIWDQTLRRIFLKDTFPLSGTLIRNLDWGHQYEWQVTALVKGKKQCLSPKRSFSLLTNKKVDTTKYRNNVVVNKLHEDSLYILLDNPGIIIDLRGKPVWFYPDTTVARVFNLKLLDNGDVAALKPNGTQSANENLALEQLTFDGLQVWKAPKNSRKIADSSDHYHHDYQLLSNGHYLVLGNEFVLQKGMYVRYGTVIEYDSAGRAVWFWSSRDYLKEEDLFAEGLKDNPAHLNSLYLDEATNQLWLSFRYLDRVIVLDKGTEKVLRSIGRKMPSGEAQEGDGLIARQHSAHLLDANKRLMLLYDNRQGWGSDTVSSLLLLDVSQHPPTVRYRFPMYFGYKQGNWSESKGDADYMGERKFLVNMGSVPRTAIVDTSKGVVWQCEHLVRAGDNLWLPMEEHYRADFTRTLYPQRWNITIGEGKRLSRKMASYPMVIFNFGVKGFYNVFVYDTQQNLLLQTEGQFTDQQNFQFTSVQMPRKGKRNKPLSSLVISDKKTGEIYYQADIYLRKR